VPAWPTHRAKAQEKAYRKRFLKKQAQRAAQDARHAKRVDDLRV
jgi:hypothetical protein